MTILINDLNIYKIEEFHNELIKELELKNDLLSLDFTNVEKIDLSSIQLILSTKKYCDVNNIKFTITDIKTKQVKQMLKMFNLYEKLGVQL